MLLLNTELWSEITKLAPYALILVSALAGGASSFVHEGQEFKLGSYLFEVLSSIIAGAIVFLVLETTNTPEELIAASAMLATYFGTKMLSIFYQVFITRLKRASGLKEEEGRGN